MKKQQPTVEDTIRALINSCSNEDEETVLEPTTQAILALLAQEKKTLLEELKEFSIDLVVSCNADCTPEQHMFHTGTWDAHMRLEEKLEALRKGIE